MHKPLFKGFQLHKELVSVFRTIRSRHNTSTPQAASDVRNIAAPWNLYRRYLLVVPNINCKVIYFPILKLIACLKLGQNFHIRAFFPIAMASKCEAVYATMCTADPPIVQQITHQPMCTSLAEAHIFANYVNRRWLSVANLHAERTLDREIELVGSITPCVDTHRFEVPQVFHEEVRRCFRLFAACFYCYFVSITMTIDCDTTVALTIANFIGCQTELDVVAVVEVDGIAITGTTNEDAQLGNAKERELHGCIRVGNHANLLNSRVKQKPHTLRET